MSSRIYEDHKDLSKNEDNHLHSGTNKSEFKNEDNHLHSGTNKSEFTLVDDRSKGSSEFGLLCIRTLDELNERIANVSSTIAHSSEFDDDLSVDEYDARTDGRVNDVDKSKLNVILPEGAIVQSNIIKKPLLVELQLFPGFYEDKGTPLPSNLSALFILKVIIKGKVDLQSKPSFKKIFKDFFLCRNSQGILGDIFWWYFCHKYQPSAEAQEKIFDRIARNYTNLLVSWTGSKYEDKLFKDYADVMSQAVYSTFSHAYPTSYRQFNGEFCDDILSLINMWMMGIKPAPRTWDKWNFEIIEPDVLWKGRTITDNVEKVDNLETKLEKLEEKPLSASSHVRKLSGDEAMRKISSLPLKSPSKLISHTSSSNKHKNKRSLANMMQQISSVLSLHRKMEQKNSSAEAGPTFQKVVFNLYGRSPLVEHFLTSHHLLKDAGTSVLIQRTQIETLPPLSAQTYQDVIDKVKSNSRRSLNNYHVMSTQRQKEYQDMLHKHKVDHENFTKSSLKLLSNPHEVRKLSELLRAKEGKEE